MLTKAKVPTNLADSPVTMQLTGRKLRPNTPPVTSHPTELLVELMPN